LPGKEILAENRCFSQNPPSISWRTRSFWPDRSASRQSAASCWPP